MDNETKNLAETLAEVLPKAALLQTTATDVPGLFISHVAVPRGTEIREVKIDLESTLANPRATKAIATFAAPEAFLAYVKRHAFTNTIVWCEFDPQTFKLSFNVVFDEHAKDKAGWRRHQAKYTPDMSAEWKAWTGKNKSSFGQVEFAEWIEEHAEDITVPADMEGKVPTSLQMLEMATNFVATQDSRLVSTANLQSGGVRLEYVADETEETKKSMEMFKQFAIGIPVFQGVNEGWGITARLKHRKDGQKVKFHYELARPDRTHKAAATKLIEQIKTGLGDEIPLLLGACQ